MPPGQLPPFFATRSKATLDKTASPRSNDPSCDKESMYSVYYVIIVTGIGNSSG